MRSFVRRLSLDLGSRLLGGSLPARALRFFFFDSRFRLLGRSFDSRCFGVGLFLARCALLRLGLFGLFRFRCRFGFDLLLAGRALFGLRFFFGFRIGSSLGRFR